jgi:UDP-arabinose 4-epimerase
MSPGEFPRPELRPQSRISGACMDAALGNIPSLTVKGTKHPTKDGSCEAACWGWR